MSISVVLVFQRPTRGEHGTVHLGEGLPRMFEKELPSARQPHPSFGAIEQLAHLRDA